MLPVSLSKLQSHEPEKSVRSSNETILFAISPRSNVFNIGFDQAVNVLYVEGCVIIQSSGCELISAMDKVCSQRVGVELEIGARIKVDCVRLSNASGINGNR